MPENNNERVLDAELDTMIRENLSRDDRIQLATTDLKFRGAMEWLLWGKTDFLSDWEINGGQGLDAAKLWDHISTKYDLDESAMEEAADIAWKSAEGMDQDNGEA